MGSYLEGNLKPQECLKQGGRAGGMGESRPVWKISPRKLSSFTGDFPNSPYLFSNYLQPT